MLLLEEYWYLHYRMIEYKKIKSGSVKHGFLSGNLNGDIVFVFISYFHIEYYLKLYCI